MAVRKKYMGGKPGGISHWSLPITTIAHFNCVYGEQYEEEQLAVAVPTSGWIMSMDLKQCAMHINLINGQTPVCSKVEKEVSPTERACILCVLILVVLYKLATLIYTCVTYA